VRGRGRKLQHDRELHTSPFDHRTEYELTPGDDNHQLGVLSPRLEAGRGVNSPAGRNQPS